MCLKMCLIIGLVFTVVACSSPIDQESQKTVIKQAVLKMYASSEKEDLGDYLSYIPDALIEQLGGVEKATTHFEATLSDSDIIRLDTRIVEVSEVIREKDCISSAVTILSAFKNKGVRATQQIVLIAFSVDNGLTWKFYSSLRTPEQDQYLSGLFPALFNGIKMPMYFLEHSGKKFERGG